ncbi:MAG TPA: hypothetical protein VKW04_11240 [Planctomycetota bacterium]|nr:hypothetical protein [Planctomycetota bacterium]
MTRKAWTWSLGILGGALLLVGAVFWTLQRRATAVFERYDARARRMLEGLRSQPWPRARLAGSPTPGDGWPVHLQALQGFGSIMKEETDEIPEMSDDPDAPADLEVLEDLFQKYSPLIDQLKEANRRSEFHPKHDLPAELVSFDPDARRSIRTARFLAGRAVHFCQSGRRTEGLESLALGISLGHDTARGGLIGHFLVQLACERAEEDALRELLKSHDFTAHELGGLARALDQLRATRPEVGPAFDAEEASVYRFLSDWGLSGAPSPGAALHVPAIRSWKWLYSQRLALSGALGELDRLFGEARGIASLPPTLKPSAMQKIIAQADLHENPMIWLWLQAANRVCYRDAVAQMGWTLMTVSVAIARFDAEEGTPPDTLEDLVPRYLPKVPRCPFSGQALGYSQGRVWSVGKNLVDDQGTPGRNDDLDDQDGDVVWTVMRK